MNGNMNARFTSSSCQVAPWILLIFLVVFRSLIVDVYGFDVATGNALLGTDIAFIVPQSSSIQTPFTSSTTTSDSLFDLQPFTKADSSNHDLGKNEVDDDNDEFSTTYLGPPIGAKYESRLRVPVIGTQIFSLHIRSMTQAHLTVAGRLDVNERVQYSFDKSSGKLNFTLSEHLKSKLRRYLTQLQEVGYDSRTDTPYVKVLPPLPAAIKIMLKRV